MQYLSTHVVIPDLQIKPGVPTAHLGWIGRYIADEFAGRAIKVINLGDHYDLPSLSSYDKKGSKKMVDARVVDDIEAGELGFDLITGPAHDLPARKRPAWEWHYLYGNHENRAFRAMDDDVTLEGLFDLRYAERWGWEIHDFLDVVYLDGVAYSHYFYNPNTGRPYGGQSMDTRLKTIGHSFTMGHQQGLMQGIRNVLGTMHRGLVCGSAYLHEEAYKGPQGNTHWRGIIICHEVEDGNYSLMEVSLDYLCRRYEHRRLSEFLA